MSSDHTHTREGESPTVSDVLLMSERIITAYITSNPTSVADMPKLITSVHASVAEISQTSIVEVHHRETVAPPEPHRPPAVPIEDSLTDGYIVCLEDGERYRSLKRHLRAQHHMTPDQYRNRWGLSPDYPMSAPDYSKKRSEMAKKMGLGRQD